MSKTIKTREPKKARNWDVVGMIVACKGGTMRDRRERRMNEKEDYLAEYQDDIECEEDF